MSKTVREGYTIDSTGYPVTVVRPGDTVPCFYCRDLAEAYRLIDIEQRLDCESSLSKTQ